MDKLMDADSSPLSEITQLDAAVQRLLTLRSEHGRGGAHPLLKQTLAQVDQAIEELQVMFEEMSQGRDDVQRVVEAIEAERARRLELMESLSIACVFTDEKGVILEANTSAFLLLGVSVEGVGRETLCDAAVDRDACAAMLARAEAESAVTE